MSNRRTPLIRGSCHNHAHAVNLFPPHAQPPGGHPPSGSVEAPMRVLNPIDIFLDSGICSDEGPPLGQMHVQRGVRLRRVALLGPGRRKEIVPAKHGPVVGHARVESAIGPAIVHRQMKRQSASLTGRRPSDVLPLDCELAVGLESFVALRIDAKPQRPDVLGRALAKRQCNLGAVLLGI